MPRFNIAELVLGEGAADAPAVLYGRQMLSYGELRARASGWALRLLDAKVAPGDRVGLFAENCPYFIAAYFGTILAGACVVPIPPDCSETIFGHIVGAMAIRKLFVSARFLARVIPWAEKWRVDLLAEPDDPPRGPAQVPIREIDPRRDLSAIMLTSGSTGGPKGVMVTHRNIECNSRDIIHYMGLTARDRVMVVLPFHYCYGASLMHTHLMAGGSLVLNNRFMFPEKVLDEMESQRCTGLAGVPSTYQVLLRKSRFLQRNFPALRWLQQAGGRLPNPFIREIRQAFPAVKLYVMYGQTEATARLSYLPPEHLDDKLGSIGRGLPHGQLEVLHADETPVRPGSNDVGEIVATGEHVTQGYWADPEETSRYFRNGRLYTGDLACVDQDGFIFIAGRARDFIKAMGNRVSAAEVEEVLAELPQVVEQAVIGVPDEIWGEAIQAFLVIAGPGQLTAEDVRDHCRKRLPNYKVPRHVKFVSSLPKTNSGKIARERLRGS